MPLSRQGESLRGNQLCRHPHRRPRLRLWHSSRPACHAGHWQRLADQSRAYPSGPRTCECRTVRHPSSVSVLAASDSAGSRCAETALRCSVVAPRLQRPVSKNGRRVWETGEGKRGRPHGRGAHVHPPTSGWNGAVGREGRPAGGLFTCIPEVGLGKHISLISPETTFIRGFGFSSQRVCS